MKIQGLYGELVGKSRGELTRTDDWYIVVHAEDFVNALYKVTGTFGLRYINPSSPFIFGGINARHGRDGGCNSYFMHPLVIHFSIVSAFLMFYWELTPVWAFRTAAFIFGIFQLL